MDERIRCCALMDYRYRSREPLSDRIVSSLVFFFVILQPLLDIASYFSIVKGFPNISLAVRTLLLGSIAVLSIIAAQKKWHVWLFYGVIALFWAVHMLTCYQSGYRDPVSDLTYFIKIVQIPIYTFGFFLFFCRYPNCGVSFQLGVTVNIYIISLSIILAAVTNTMSHTYWYTQRGILGWFYSGNAQSAILAAMLPIALVYTQKISRCFFGVTALLGFGNLFLIGTRVAYGSIFIIAFGMAAAFLWSWAKKKKGRWWKSLLLVLAVLVLCAGGYTISPMYQSREEHKQYMEEKEANQEQQIIEYPGDDPYAAYRELYQTYCKELVDTFGLENTLKQYDYSTDIQVISDARLKKRNFAQMQWERKSNATHWMGYEYETFMAGNTSMEPENDFHVIFYLYGYVGLGLFFCFLLGIVGWGIKRLWSRQAKWSNTLWACMLSGALMLGSSLLAGHTLVRPNVSVYLSLILALGMYLLKETGKKRLDAEYPEEGKHFAD